MYKLFIPIILLLLALAPSRAQEQVSDYLGDWEGELPETGAFHILVLLDRTGPRSYQLSLSNPDRTIHSQAVFSDKGKIRTHIGGPSIHDGRAVIGGQAGIGSRTRIDLDLNADPAGASGFIISGMLMYHVVLEPTTDGKLMGTWNPFMVENLRSPKVYLSVESQGDDGFAFYPFFADHRFTGTWCGGFEQAMDRVDFRDFKTGLEFRASLNGDSIRLDILLAGSRIVTTDLIRSESEWELGFGRSNPEPNTDVPPDLDDGWKTGSLDAFGIDKGMIWTLMDSINRKSLENTHSVLIAIEGHLIFEAYFDGYDARVPHDQRSASKSISSAIIGIAIDEGLLKGSQTSIGRLLPEEYREGLDPKKAEIRLEDLLTMGSGIDAIDFGIDRSSAASEGAYQSSEDWLMTVLDAPMIHPPGEHAYYGSANPYLLGVVLEAVLEMPVEQYMDRKLFAPLGIKNYIIQTERTGKAPYFGGGIYLTPRDMLKFGQLYLNRGTWEGEEIVSPDWVEASFRAYRQLENTTDKNPYGYLWWHNTYRLGNRDIRTVEARGAGGQYIVVISELDAVVVVTSGNYHNGKYMQPEQILEQYLLPAMIGEASKKG